MPTLRQLLCTSLASSLLFTAGTAEARFGKRSDSSSSSSDNVHDASPVGSSDGSSGGSSSGGSSSGGSSSGGSSSVSDTVNTVGALLDVLFFVADTAERVNRYEAQRHYETTRYDSSAAVELEPGQQPMYAYGQEPVVQQQQVPEARKRNMLMFRLGLEGQTLGEGSAVGFNVGIEGEHWGVAAAATGLRLPADDGTAGVDEIGLFSAHLTLALYSSDHARLRLEGGVATAKAPDVTFAGPSFALSFERCLFGALDLEGRGQVVPVPYIQVDTQAGLALHLNAVTLRTGWRFQLLDDRGVVDGVVHRDYFSGPYAGIGLNF
ncbi:hypothetical protein NR798_44285 [Archangium gephyra]|uniref:hypothetical protein n=1 Tax=Archangium gephyra TaxID=48 RepID=UPI0035D435FB